MHTDEDFDSAALEPQFLSFIRTRHLFSPEQRILLTVSGGLDSVVMTELFRRAGFVYGIAHVNFQLRGLESDQDEDFVRALAAQHGVQFHTVRKPTTQKADEWGVSTQMAARTLRYEWFDQLADEFGYERVATAHHQDDVLETILLNLVRGTGLSGLLGIPVRQGRIIRPLWFANRSILEQYALHHALHWREDSSNTSDYYRRNRLRHQLIPVLKAINPNLLQTLQTTIARLQSADTLVENVLNHSWNELVVHRSGKVLLDISRLVLLPEWEFQLSEWLKPYGFHYAQLAPIADAVQHTNFGQRFYSATHQLLRDRQLLVIEPKILADDKPIVLPALPTEAVPVFDQYRLQFELIDKSDDFQIPVNPHVACLDADKMEWPLTIRRWQSGDRFRPLGLRGSQTVGDFLTNHKISLSDRSSVTVLTTTSQIAWLIGYRPDDRFRITTHTQKVLLIEQRSI
ncbi:tRNA lysidine(34) synthetase TilS [Larkinella harenae]